MITRYAWLIAALLALAAAFHSADLRPAPPAGPATPKASPAAIAEPEPAPEASDRLLAGRDRWPVLQHGSGW